MYVETISSHTHTVKHEQFSNNVNNATARKFRNNFATIAFIKNVVFWDVALCRSCVNRRFGGKFFLHLQLQPPAQAGSPFEDFSTLKMEAILSSETPVDERCT
jgi:hypothetical protein